MPIAKKAPLRRIGHWLPYYFNNSKAGISKTARLGIHWHDLDFGLTKDGRWRVSHQAPEKVFFKTGRMRDYLVAAVDRMHYKGYEVLRPRVLFRHARNLKVNIEIEPKQKDVRYKEIKYWNRLARTCEKVWGKNWQQHVYVKVLDIHGKPFAINVIKTASKAGFTAGPTRRWDIPDKYL